MNPIREIDRPPVKVGEALRADGCATRSAVEWLDIARTQEARFWSKVDKSGECWLWTTGKDKDGYGKFTITAPRRGAREQRHVRAHRLSWEMVHGVSDSTLVVMHECDTPACVNPAHLSLGTQAENRADCGRKGRNATGDGSGARRHPESRPRGDCHPSRTKPECLRRGEQHPGAKMSVEKAQLARAELANGKSQLSVALMFGVSQRCIWEIAAGKRWRA